MEDVCVAKQGNRSLTAYPKVFDLLNTDTIIEAKDCLEIFASMALEGRPVLVVVEEGPQQNIWLLWEIDLLPVLFTNS